MPGVKGCSSSTHDASALPPSSAEATLTGLIQPSRRTTNQFLVALHKGPRPARIHPATGASGCDETGTRKKRCVSSPPLRSACVVVSTQAPYRLHRKHNLQESSDSQSESYCRTVLVFGEHPISKLRKNSTCATLTVKVRSSNDNPAMAVVSRFPFPAASLLDATVSILMLAGMRR